jgi:hypothetical protein
LAKKFSAGTCVAATRHVVPVSTAVPTGIEPGSDSKSWAGWTTGLNSLLAWCETDAQSTNRVSPIRCTSNEDGLPMCDDALEKALRIMGGDTVAGDDHCARSLRSSASTLLNEEGAFDGDVVEAQLAP